MKRTSSMHYEPSAEADELELFADSDSTLYFNRILPAIKNLSRKYARGTYDRDKAVDLWYYVADAAAKEYGWQFGTRCTFTVTERFTCAVLLEQRFFENVNGQNFIEGTTAPELRRETA